MAIIATTPQLRAFDCLINIFGGAKAELKGQMEEDGTMLVRVREGRLLTRVTEVRFAPNGALIREF